MTQVNQNQPVGKPAESGYSLRLQGGSDEFLMEITTNEQPSRDAHKDSYVVHMTDGWPHGTVEFTLDEDQRDSFLRTLQSLYDVAHWSERMRQMPDHIHPDAPNWR